MSNKRQANILNWGKLHLHIVKTFIFFHARFTTNRILYFTEALLFLVYCLNHSATELIFIIYIIPKISKIEKYAICPEAWIFTANEN